MEKRLLQEADKERLFGIPLFRDLPHNIKLSLLDKLDYAVYDAKKKDIIASQGIPCKKGYSVNVPKNQDGI
ncbi:hypothetical protein [Bacteroides gallinarum]|uniref:hypothetical protein n=1 Tax=Bacteroides gallinarum TaxID=376806 RepID=UPI0012B52D15|nr:hypothetical protein [Bacteroides gallinarum]